MLGVSLNCYTIFLRQGLSLDFKFSNLFRLASPEASGILLFLP